MTKRISIIAVAIFASLFCASGARAQANRLVDPECAGPVFKQNEVSRPATLIEPPDFSGVTEVFRGVRGRVRLEAVVCRTGRVTNIKIQEGLTSTVNEFVTQAMSIVRFRPAELNWHSVSQTTGFEFDINDGEVNMVQPAPPNGALVEAVNVVGNRRLPAKDILSSIYTRVGEPFNQARIKGDLNRLLATGFFDKTTTRVVAESGARGGLNISFLVQELPIVGEIKFEGLTIEQFFILQALKSVGVQPGSPYTPQAGQAGVRLIRQMLAVGNDYSKVYLREESKDAQSVNLVFVITKP